MSASSSLTDKRTASCAVRGAASSAEVPALSPKSAA